MVIGFPFGQVSRNVLLWVLSGMIAGTVAGLIVEMVFRPLVEYERLYPRRLLLLVTVEALVTILVLIPGYAAYQVVHPVRYPVSVTPADLGLEYEDVTLTTTDEIVVMGWYIPSRNRAAIIAVHALQGNRTNTLYHAQALGQHGYGVLLLDLRAHGESGGDAFAAGWNSDQEILAAVDYLQSRQDVDSERIGALGLSVGANAIIYAAVESNDIKALWADGTGVGRLEDLQNPLPPEFRPLRFMSPVYWMYDHMIAILSDVGARPPIKEQVRLIAPRPIMFVSAGQGWEQFQARKYHANAGDAASIWELPHDTHIGGLRARPGEYVERMNTFFDTHLLGIKGSS